MADDQISAVFHLFSRRDSRSHAAALVIRKTKRRHMIGDHHDQTPEWQPCWPGPWATFSARTIREIVYRLTSNPFRRDRPKFKRRFATTQYQLLCYTLAFGINQMSHFA